MSITAVRARPILFSGEMVRAILRGEKTQTRRIIKPQPEHGVERCWYTGSGWAFGAKDGACTCSEVPCRFIAGDLLWVRETWLELDRDHWHDYRKRRADLIDCSGRPRRNSCAYRADTDADGDEIRKEYGYKWTPSIHMPRWASRITLEITDVRVQRLHDIKEPDAIAEGCKGRSYRDGRGYESAGHAFSLLWESINGPGSWESNPFVWAITFKKL